MWLIFRTKQSVKSSARLVKLRKEQISTVD